MINKPVLLEKYVKGYLNSKIDLTDYGLDLERFDNERNLYDYQKDALQNITRLLINYFSDDGKSELLNYYNIELEDELKQDFSFTNENSHFDLLKGYYSEENGEISYKNFLNRASFWMATGSGKTLIIVKLIELLYELMSQKVIPEKKVLVVTPNDDIFKQINDHVHKFNETNFRYANIQFRNIRQYEKREFAGINPLQPDSLTVYHTRSTVLSNENKENMIDFSSYIESDGWYIILDEAHKGKDDESLRKQYLNILSRNGFMFNFSATFVDNLDVVSTISNFNLSEFIKAGYGKNIKVLDDEFRNFKAKNKQELNDNLSDSEKREIILKSLIVYTSIKKQCRKIKEIDTSLYHNPLMLTISNEINTNNADMKIYFKYLSEIAASPISEDVLKMVKNSIINNLEDNLQYTVGEENLDSEFKSSISNVTYQDILSNVYNSDTPGRIEVYQIGSNNNELSFRLKSSINSVPFAIIKASDVYKWRNNILEDYLFNEDIVVDKSRFKDIHKKNNEINILMGSRQFIEGWDSNRPNVINFINMGTNDENTKLILQAIGRGVRVEPIPNVRTRFKLTDESITEFNKDERSSIINYGELLETLFVFATNKQVVSNIIKELNIQDDNWNVIKGIQRTNIKEKLQVPVYRELNYNNKDFRISKVDFNKVNQLVNNTPDKLLIVRDDFRYETIKGIKNGEKIEVVDEKPTSKKPKEVLRNIEKHRNMKTKELVGFRIEAPQIDIKHYKHFQTTYSDEDLFKLEEYIRNSISQYMKRDFTSEQQEFVNDLITIYQDGREPGTALMNMAKDMGIYEDDLLNLMNENELEEKYGLELKNIQSHYYKPMIISNSNKFKYSIKENSEIDFVKNLEEYLKADNSKTHEFDWWYFSKLNESTDEIYIPYYDTEKQLFRNFYPDFIFWLKIDNQYFLKFVDPKGLRLSPQNAIDKVRGFEEVFNDDNIQDDSEVNVELLYYYPSDSGNPKLEEYRFYDISKIFDY
ncbi:hypothetical protein Pryu01_02439 [Paraliobacillus ryukyuensis]|uniref:Helicase ATP-binding domain-containing protein n=1 Tax=Paraliobacillus ryukyuensis TaxID=200904 RepID=A0A366DWC6_9BACI|nr:DEAD/DEAH box helicase family protein [Paraliobacillus ryukyuensis]RBO93574.1 hypothetical protein DES48_11185 [Paraliobacillus ryukyuensis]